MYIVTCTIYTYVVDMRLVYVHIYVCSLAMPIVEPHERFGTLLIYALTLCNPTEYSYICI